MNQAQLRSEALTSKQLLMDTARSLFAEQGVDGVSLREIAREAGHRNTNAVQYHFGDRNALLLAVLAPFEAHIGARRAALLDELDRDAQPVMRSVAGALVRPSAALLADDPGRQHLRILAELIRDYSRFERCTNGVDNHLLQWSNRAKAFMPESTLPLHRRYAMMSMCFGELGKRAAIEPRLDDRLFVSDLVDLGTGVLQASVSAETEALLRERDGASSAKAS